MEEAGGLEIRRQGELPGWPAVGYQQNQAEVDDTDDPMDKEAPEALLATQLEIDKHRFRLCGIRTRQLPRRQTKTTLYRVVWYEHPNRSDSWVNEDGVTSIPACRDAPCNEINLGTSSSSDQKSVNV
jgi:hypothetical protein